MISDLSPIKLGSPGEEICKKDLQAVTRRFKNLHHLRQQRIQEYLHPRQRIFLHLLPLLFHQNNPLLPGFISSETPMGIPDYNPNTSTIRTAKLFSSGFNYKRRALRSHPIHGLFLMGSVSSIAFSKASDMDIWLCHEAEIPTEELKQLQSKASAVEKWAASLNLEVHFFLIDSEQFLSGQDTPISTESSGQTQHYLLLEEFYRTAIYIAGRIPVWWLVPPHEENNYTAYVDHLIRKRFISSTEIIDLGGLEAVPATEFISATLWHLYKSINSPHKSLLKLLLMESYASEYPEPQWLCLDLKNAIYHGKFAIDDIDPYLLIYRKVDRYLQHSQDPERLSLARQCFYLKIMGETGTTSLNPMSQVRIAFLQRTAKKWQWPKATLKQFGEQKYWNIKTAIQEHKTIMRELTQCFRMTTGFASKYVEKDYRNNNDLILIGRKLSSFLEKKPGKIELITTRSTLRSKESNLSIVEIPMASGISGWSLFTGIIPPEEALHVQPIKQCWKLIEILVWLVVNSLYHTQLRIHFESSSLKIARVELHTVLIKLKQFLSDQFNQANKSLDIYKQQNSSLASIVFINTGFPLPDERQDGLLTISDRDDVLSYGSGRENLVYTLDQVSVSSWGEITTSHHTGIEGLFSCLAETINKGNDRLKESDLTVICNTRYRGKSISLRIEKVFAKLVKLFAHPKADSCYRYFLPAGPYFFIFQRKNQALCFWQLDNEDMLLIELSSAQETFSPAYFDHKVLASTPIPFLFKYNTPQLIQVFYNESKNGVDIYIIDEKGALFTQQHNQSTPKQLLASYAAFLESILNRRLADFSLAINYYEIQKNSAGILSCFPVEIETGLLWQHLNVRITGEENQENQTIYTIYCNDLEFSSLLHGDQVFKAAAAHILELRQGTEHYPIHITDIDVPLFRLGLNNAKEVQTIHYLKYKQKMETRLNG